MSSNSTSLKSSEDPEVMVRQVNLAAAFHDHISCTKISQHSIQTSICGLQTSAPDVNDPQSPTIHMAPEPSVAFESDHMYATESKSLNDNNCLPTNGLIGRTNSLFSNSLSDERNQISKLTEMILGQLDLIQHQQEQLLKKDRQLQGLKQDREALCLRLEKMEKRIAVLTTKVANSANNALNNSNTNITNNTNNCINSNNNNNNNTNNSLNLITNNSINCTRNVVNSQSNSNTIETDCDQSESDTIIEDNNSAVGLFTDPTVFTKLYSNSSVNTCNTNVNNVNDSTISSDCSKSEAIINTTCVDTNSSTNTKIKVETQIKIECEDSVTDTTTTTSCLSVRKSRKRHPEVSAPTVSTTTVNKKRNKTSISTNSSDTNTTDVKKDMINIKETSSDSSTLSTLQSSKTYINNKKKVNKQKSETSSRLELTSTAVAKSSVNCRSSSLTRDVLLTPKPYNICVNYSELSVNTSNSVKDDSVDNKPNSSLPETKLIEDKTQDLSCDEIETPNWRLHPVSSCYSLEGTENLDDEVFNRRHQKLENDEKRRKRWDVQRLREQRHNEKLRTGRYYSSSLGNCFIEKPSDLKKKSFEFTSFYPDIKNLQSIEVAEKIPYIAFGHPIPKLPQKCFSLPWNVSERTQIALKSRNSSQKKN